MPRKPLRLAAVSALALCAAACAETRTSVASSQIAAAKTPPALQGSAQKAPQPGANVETEIQRAHGLRVQGELTEAVRILAQLVLVAPDDSRVIGEYGKSLVQQGRSDDAVLFLKRAVQLKPGDWTFYSALGVAYDQMDDSKNAAAAYQHALVLRPGDAATLNNYAVSRMLAGDLNGAEKLLRQAQAAGGSNPKLPSNLALLAQLKAKTASSVQTGHAATKSPQALASIPNAKPVISAPTHTQAFAAVRPNTNVAAPPIHSTVVMQPVPNKNVAMPVTIANKGPQAPASAPAGGKPDGEARKSSQTLASVPASSKLTAPQPLVRSTVVMQTVPRDKPAALVKVATKPPQALASAPLNLKPAAPSQLPSKMMEPKDTPAKAVKVAGNPPGKPTRHLPISTARVSPAKGAPTTGAPAKSPVPALRTADQGE